METFPGGPPYPFCRMLALGAPLPLLAWGAYPLEPTAGRGSRTLPLQTSPFRPSCAPNWARAEAEAPQARSATQQANQSLWASRAP